MPQTFYTQEEYLAAEQRAIFAEGRLATLEALRPQWAKGFTNDSVAAQINALALSQIWNELDVNNQTEAMQRIRYLKNRFIHKPN